MREIKFRIFDGSKMEYNIMAGIFGAFYVNPTNLGWDEKDTASISPYNTKYPEAIDVMQFTGLKDITGKDIYEGDIIHWHGVNLEVKFIVDGWFAEDIDEAITEVGQEWESSCSIIGNIYENPELLVTE